MGHFNSLLGKKCVVLSWQKHTFLHRIRGNKISYVASTVLSHPTAPIQGPELGQLELELLCFAGTADAALLELLELLELLAKLLLELLELLLELLAETT
jgi:hypothetical protein